MKRTKIINRYYELKYKSRGLRKFAIMAKTIDMLIKIKQTVSEAKAYKVLIRFIIIHLKCKVRKMRAIPEK